MLIPLHKGIFGLALLSALASCGGDKSVSNTSTANGGLDQTERNRTFTVSEREAIFATLKLTSGGEDKVINACGEAVTPALHSVQLGGPVGTAVLVVLGGGDNNPSCYGMTGMEITLLQINGSEYKTLLSAQGQLGVLTTATNGVQDIAIGGPGFEFPVYSWNGTALERTGTIADTEFPIPVN